MHIEKNTCESLLGTLLEIAGKTKDTEKAQLDLQDMGIRKDQHLLAIDFDDFYRQYSFGFHSFRTMLLYFSLTLTSSMSFVECLSPGAACTKMSRNGVNPRPAGLPLQHFVVQLCGTWFEPKIKVTPMWFRQNSQVKTERLEPS